MNSATRPFVVLALIVLFVISCDIFADEQDAAGRIDNREMVLKAVMDRERVMSTGMGDGVAIPHAKTDGVKDLVAAFGVTKQGIDFQSIDGKPVRIIFLLAGPTDQTGPHLKALSRISRLMHRKEFRDILAVCGQ